MKRKFAVWSYIRVSEKSTREINKFFLLEYKIPQQFLYSQLHLTIYQSFKLLTNVEQQNEICDYSIDTNDTRFMVLAPGGENPKFGLIPAEQKVGFRIKKDSELRIRLDEHRKFFIQKETIEVLGNRNASTTKKNAFGPKNFQPHVTLIKAGSGIISNLSDVGANFREKILDIQFDKFSVIINN